MPAVGRSVRSRAAPPCPPDPAAEGPKPGRARPRADPAPRPSGPCPASVRTVDVMRPRVPIRCWDPGPASRTTRKGLHDGDRRICTPRARAGRRQRCGRQ
ncbi:hypothetical protein CffCFBP3418_01710 [Curtobacterium flaccumfaciens pv. flaccumfaciens]|nr:hypothetical protein CffCFBP3418_01710 [Curtobacterium flaccumfaciens pv. flaccumfaciens]